MIRDPHSKALIADDRAALDKYRVEKQRIRQIEQLRKDVAALQETVKSICATIDRIAEKRDS